MSESKGPRRPLRLGVLLSGGGRTLANILKEIGAGRLAAEVAVVIASRPCKGVQIAKSAGLDAHVVSYKDRRDDESYSGEISRLLEAAGVELVCMAGFLSMWRIPPQYAGRVMNIHPALLPDFGGQGFYGTKVHEAVLAAGAKQTGCTVHFVNNRYDAGPIIIQRTVPVMPGDTVQTLADRVFEQECIAYPRAIALFTAGRLAIEGDKVRILPEVTAR